LSILQYKKAALIYDVSAEFNFDFLALSETRISADMPDTIKLDFAQNGYDVLHFHQSPNTSHLFGGGLAFIHRTTFNVKLQTLASTLNPASFEIQLV
jgi:hypothetical protein